MYKQYYSEIYHHGIKGQKWGVRRFQNEDGTYTELGRRIRNASRTKKQVDEAYRTLSKEDYYLLDETNDKPKEWLADDKAEFVVKRITKKKDGKVVGVMDIFQDGDVREYGKNAVDLAIAIFTTPEGRGKGYAKEMAAKGVKWFDEHKMHDKLNSMVWWARTENIPSQKTALGAGFKYIPSESDDEWKYHEYK